MLRNILFTALLLFPYSSIFAQYSFVNFGIPFVDTISWEHSEDYYITDIKLLKLNKKASKLLFNTNRLMLTDLKKDTTKKVELLSKIGKKHVLLVPPLQPNRFYQLKIEYVNRNNLYCVFKCIQEQGMEQYKENKEWMEILQNINDNIEDNFSILAHPQAKELKEYKDKLEDYDLQRKLAENSLTKEDSLALSNVIFSEFEILNFRKKEITLAQIFSFNNEILSTDTFNELSGINFIDNFGAIPDYLKIYQFYQKQLESLLNGKPFPTPTEFKTILEEKIALEATFLGKKNKQDATYFLPNFLNKSLYKTYPELIVVKLLNTNPIDYSTAIKRSLTADFGYHIFLPYENSLTGGTPYLGVHLDLTPVNKNVSLRLYKLPFHQRLSLHTGITLNSLAKENFRKDFFNKYSPFIGVGCKIFSQSTRFSVGGILLKKTDIITDEERLRIQPYIGLSIDIEIRKWLQGVIPGLPSIIPK